MDSKTGLIAITSDKKHALIHSYFRGDSQPTHKTHTKSSYMKGDIRRDCKDIGLTMSLHVYKRTSHIHRDLNQNPELLLASE